MLGRVLLKRGIWYVEWLFEAQFSLTSFLADLEHATKASIGTQNRAITQETLIINVVTTFGN